jgi:D-alanyl-lipoteichoic acid acyltransferase DltB (MBOAT superfamily)
MLFNSWAFVPFLVAVLALYYLLPHRWQNGMLLFASCAFYGAWDWRFLFLLLVSTSIDYVVGIKLHASDSPGRRKTLLAASCAANLGILCFFKYFNFFTDTAAQLLRLGGMNVSAAHLNIIMPVGISFYTFHAMSYTIDIYRKKIEPVYSFPSYMLFVLYFPQLVAGPIARAANLLPQVTRPRSIRYEQVLEGSWLMLWGFFKKMVVADNLAILVDSVFDSALPVKGGLCLLAVYAFAFQIYCDFSGYTDIARGIGKLMGFELALNFNLPYLARNPSEFWHRWHISLSTWLRDYLYIPLGGSRCGTVRTYANLLITMLLGGLWHGAAWTFVFWGAYHGALLMLHRYMFGEKTKDERAHAGILTSVLSRLLTFHLVCLGWLFFRARTIGQAASFLRSICADLVFERGTAELLFLPLFLIGVLWILELWLRNADDVRNGWGWRWGLGPLTVSLLFATIWFLTPSDSRQFIYFQF